VDHTSRRRCQSLGLHQAASGTRPPRLARQRGVRLQAGPPLRSPSRALPRVMGAGWLRELALLAPSWRRSSSASAARFRRRIATTQRVSERSLTRWQGTKYGALWSEPQCLECTLGVKLSGDDALNGRTHARAPSMRAISSRLQILSSQLFGSIHRSAGASVPGSSAPTVCAALPGTGCTPS
jgi:hypothetical protein